MFEDATETRRWTGAFIGVLAIHALPAAVAAWWLGPMLSTQPAEPAILIDMAAPAAPPVPPSEQPPGPKQVKEVAPRPKVRDDPIKMPPVINPAVSAPVSPPEPPRVEAKEPAPDTTAPPVPQVPPAPALSNAVLTWQGLVLGQLNKFKRYPAAAQSRHQQGVPWIRFVMDRQGKVLSCRLERSSGFSALDEEAVALPQRAQPLPKPPADIGNGATIELVVPVEFFMRR